jgi:hypothetical protein
MEILNSREIAVVVWSVLLFGAAIWKAKAWSLVRAVVRTFCKPMLLGSIAAMGIYVAISAWLLSKVGLWELSNLKTTIVWFVTFALSWMFNMARWNADPNDGVRTTLKELLGVTTFVTFLTEFYTFHLAVELALVPLVTFIVLISTFAKGRASFALVEKVFGGLLSIIGFALLGHAIYRLLNDLGGFATVDTGREFAAPALLSLMFIPFMYVFNVYVAYDTMARVLPRRLEEGGAGQYAVRRAILSFGLDVKLMRRWKAALFNRDAQTRSDVDALIATMKGAKRRERDPPLVKSAEGWSPYAAIDWLGAHGLSTSGYNPIYGDEWGASSPYRKLGGGVLGDTLAYYVRGTGHAATKLTLMLNLDRLRTDPTPQASLDAFADALFALLVGTFGEKAPRVSRGLKNKKRRTQEDGVSVRLTDNDSTIKLTITHGAHVEPY